ncbi:MAG TPA: choice-of-anchor D domain-containing protein, partial [Candidatus Cloacimonadota bacterium]|nr:choice-of-anchor D domain-containing protein [Candidatus Cloacimonadota bacterium]
GYPNNADSINVYFNSAQNLTGAILLGTIHRTSGMTPIVGADDWYEYTFNFPTNQGSNKRYVLLQAGSKYGNNIFIDDLTIEEVPLLAVFNMNQTALDFGSVNLGSSSSQQFTISNSGNATMTGQISASSEYHVSIASREMKDTGTRNTLTYSIEAGNSITYNVQFTPSNVGLTSSDMIITSNDATQPTNTIHLSGIGFTSPQIQLPNLTSGNQLSWNAVVGAAGYGIYRADSPNGVYSLVTIVTDPNYTIPMAERTGFYRITALSELPVNSNLKPIK